VCALWHLDCPRRSDVSFLGRARSPGKGVPLHRLLYGRCHLTLSLTAVSEILVKAQRDYSPNTTDAFYRARDPHTGRDSYCVPATSLKGVLRSTCESILRSFAPWLACNPFDKKPGSPGLACSHRWSSKPPSPKAVYDAICPACRTFGCTVHAGLITLEDAWVQGPVALQLKTGIAVDAVTGSVRRGPFKYKALPKGSSFRPLALDIENFALWQVGLLALALRELSEGRVRLGWGTHKGLGHVRPKVTRIDVRYPRRLYGSDPRGVCDAQRLGTGRGDDLCLLPDFQPRESTDWRDAPWIDFTLQEEGQIATFLRGCVDQALVPRLKRGYDGFAYVPPQEEAVNG